MWLASTLIALIVAIAIHFATSRLVASNAVVRFIVIGCLIGAALTYWLYRDYAWAMETLAAFLLYAFACELYIFLFTVAGFSVSANLLTRLRKEAMTESQINQLYDGAQMVRMRIDRSMEKNLIVLEADQIHLTAAGHRLVTAFNMLRALFGHPL